MSSTKNIRLNNAIRKSIMDTLFGELREKFKPQLQEIEWGAADAIYKQLIGAKYGRRLANIPAEFLDQSTTVHFGLGDKTFPTFSGRGAGIAGYGTRTLHFRKEQPKPVPTRGYSAGDWPNLMLEKKLITRAEYDEALATFDEAMDKANALIEAPEKLYNTVQTLLRECQSLNKLRTVWPECDKYLKLPKDPAKSLPTAINVKDLNAMMQQCMSKAA